MITPRILTSESKKLIGMKLNMSLTQMKIAELWGKFMPRRHEISRPVSSDLISMAMYAPHHFSAFNPSREFERWAAVEVETVDALPEGMESFDVPGGLYAIFDYRGSSADPSIFQYIFGKWLPQSDYLLDQRPHLEILGEKYKNNDPDSEEEIWIPVKQKL